MFPLVLWRYGVSYATIEINYYQKQPFWEMKKKLAIFSEIKMIGCKFYGDLRQHERMPALISYFPCEKYFIW